MRHKKVKNSGGKARCKRVGGRVESRAEGRGQEGGKRDSYNLVANSIASWPSATSNDKAIGIYKVTAVQRIGQLDAGTGYGRLPHGCYVLGWYARHG